MAGPVLSKVYLGVGSNMGDRRVHIERALQSINSLPATRMLRMSPLFESKAWGKTDQDDFLNGVVEIETGLEPQRLLAELKHIERHEGRVTGERWGPRPLDLDILLVGDLQLSSETLVVPHPRMWQRRFVLEPLFALRPDLKGPHGISIKDMLLDKHIASQEVWPYRGSRNNGSEA